MRFNHAKKNTIESELIRLTSLILLSSIILCTIISNLILYKQNYENVKRYNNDMLEQISQSTSSYFSTINLVVYNFVCNQQAQYYLIQARKDNSPTTSTISYLENNLRQISYALPGCNLHLLSIIPPVLQFIWRIPASFSPLGIILKRTAGIKNSLKFQKIKCILSLHMRIDTIISIRLKVALLSYTASAIILI